MRFVWRPVLAAAIGISLLASCTTDVPAVDLFSVPLPAMTAEPVLGRSDQPPMGLPPLTDHPWSNAAAALGQRLFFDPRLSVDSSMSCATCHVPVQGFTQHTIATSIGRTGQPLQRNTPTLYNVGHRPLLFADGRAASLAEQIWGPLLNPAEMGNPSRTDLIERINRLDEYRSEFDQVFGSAASEASLAQALSAFESSLVSADSAFDRWYFEGDDTGMTPAAKRGFFVFMASDCEKCHRMQAGSAHFTDEGFHNTGVEVVGLSLSEVIHVTPQARGVSEAPADTDSGRAAITGDLTDLRMFRTPQLRNIALTAPYMHNGVFNTLDAVVAYYNQGGSEDPMQHPLIRPLDLTAEQCSDLVSFLISLTGSNANNLSRLSP